MSGPDDLEAARAKSAELEWDAVTVGALVAATNDPGIIGAWASVLTRARERDTAQAECAAMREALMAVDTLATEKAWLGPNWGDLIKVREQVRRALSGSGKALLDRIAYLEARLAEAVGALRQWLAIEDEADPVAAFLEIRERAAAIVAKEGK